MLHGPIWNKIPRFALPVAATAILEQLFNASDIAVVGNFTGAERMAAVAAVGANSSIIGLIVNLFIDIALGANVVIAHVIGHGGRETVTKAVHTSILVSVLGGTMVALLGELAAAPHRHGHPSGAKAASYRPHDPAAHFAYWPAGRHPERRVRHFQYRHPVRHQQPGHSGHAVPLVQFAV